jgi:hypothetical protein
MKLCLVAFVAMITVLDISYACFVVSADIIMQKDDENLPSHKHMQIVS